MSSANKKPELKYTEDYSLFRGMSFNRPLHKHAPELVQSMREHGWWAGMPAEVAQNGKYLDLKSAHHRVDIARALGIGIWYVIVGGTGPDLGQREPSKSKWSISDFIHSYAKQGLFEYQRLVDIQKKTGFPWQTICGLVSGSAHNPSNNSRAVKSGTFKITNIEHANRVFRIVNSLTGCMAESILRSRSFITGISMCMHVDGFEPDRLIMRIKAVPNRVHSRATTQEMMSELEAVYNYGMRSKLNLAFLAREASAARNPIKRHATKETA